MPSIFCASSSRYPGAGKRTPRSGKADTGTGTCGTLSPALSANASMQTRAEETATAGNGAPDARGASVSSIGGTCYHRRYKGSTGKGRAWRCRRRPHHIGLQMEKPSRQQASLARSGLTSPRRPRGGVCHRPQLTRHFRSTTSSQTCSCRARNACRKLSPLLTPNSFHQAAHKVVSENRCGAKTSYHRG